MLQIWTKIWDNLGWRSVRVVGLFTTVKFWWYLLLRLKDIMRSGNLAYVDKAMSAQTKQKVTHRFGEFIIHPSVVDQLIQEDSYCYGSVRELYIRDCYFRHHAIDPNSLRVIVDLGANRGLFSTMCTPFAQRIIAVEPQTEYIPVIDYNMRINAFSNYKIINAFVSNKTDLTTNAISFRDLMNREKLSEIDFIKIDIEGAEFSLFEDLPLQAIRCMTLEVHRDFGSVESIIGKLKDNKFRVTTTDSTFRITDDADHIDYIYAQRNDL